tara:strand:- start:1024 stop:1416 length:393 start_codon:yes stop_codon:yes gene_type:complete
MDIIRKLPDDIKSTILPYTYRPQPDILMKDIQHFSHTFRRLPFYLPHFAAGSPFYDTWDCVYYGLFIENPTSLDICSILRRSHIITNDNSTRFIMNSNTKTIAKLYWALLTIEERDKYLQHYKAAIELII